MRIARVVAVSVKIKKLAPGIFLDAPIINPEQTVICVLNV